MLRSGTIPVSLLDERLARDGTSADVIIVDIRGDASSAMAGIERQRAAAPGAGIFAVALAAEPDLIVAVDARGRQRVLHVAAAGRNLLRRHSPHRRTPRDGAGRAAGRDDARVLRRQRRRRHDDDGGELRRGGFAPQQAVHGDRRPRSRVLAKSRCSSACGSATACSTRSTTCTASIASFCASWWSKHKSGLEILAGSDQFDRPGAQDGGAIEELFRILARQYEYIIVDAGSQVNSCTVAALYTADQMFLVANPDVPSIRNAQRLLDRVRQLGACGERVRFLLNRAAEPYPIPPKQIETALGHPIHHTFPSDYKTVSTALNSGVPLASTGNSDIASQFDSVHPPDSRSGADGSDADDGGKRSLLGIEKLASLW